MVEKIGEFSPNVIEALKRTIKTIDKTLKT